MRASGHRRQGPLSHGRHWPGKAGALAAARCVGVEMLPEEKTLPEGDLINGISLPAAWPPANLSFRDFAQNPPRMYSDPPYVSAPPPAIWIDRGRQLFVDDFLIEVCTCLAPCTARLLAPPLLLS